MVEIVQERLTHSQLLDKLDRYPGLIPIALDYEERRLFLDDVVALTAASTVSSRSGATA